MQVTGSVLNSNTELFDLIQAKQLDITACDALAEFAGRVCYASEARMGDAPDFISDRLREGHADVIEHGWMSFFFHRRPVFTPNRYLAVTAEEEEGWRISGNLRAWYDATDALRGVIPDTNTIHFLEYLRDAAPSVFGKNTDQAIAIGKPPSVKPKPHVQALGWCYVSGTPDAHNQATFLIDDVSRSLTHQLVRHRLFSISQQSQRYVDQNKAGWEYVIPPSIASDPESVYLYYDVMNDVQAAYNKLRGGKIRKEDARYVLPNAATTKLVVSMPFDAARHFVWLRALDKAAQWEIRGVAQEMLELLYEIAPSAWDREMEQLSTDKRLKDGLQ